MSLFDLGMKLASSKSSDGGPRGINWDSLPDVSANQATTNLTQGVVEPDPTIPTTGDYSLATFQTKVGELVDSTVNMGRTAIDKITGFVNGDQSGAVDTLKNNLIPTTSTNAESSKTPSKPAGESDSVKFFVSLTSQMSNDNVTFFVTPEITETRAANYEEVGIVHHPGQILRYKSSNPRDWGVTVKLISRTPAEAAKNLVSLNFLRGWTMPYYGEGTAKSSPQMLGAPPDILIFSAYGEKMIPPHPVVLTSFQTTYPSEIDYLPTAPDANGKTVPFPTLLTITLQLREAWSPKEFSQFSLVDYKNGDLSEAFGGMVKNSSRASSANTGASQQLSPAALSAGAPTNTSEPITVIYDLENVRVI